MNPGPADAPAVEVRPWLSVTTTVRNNAATIDRFVASVLPDLGDDGELVVVDAESTDGTAERLRSLAADHPNVLLISQPCHRGDGRNLAAARSRGSVVVTQVDGDNRYAAGAIRTVGRMVRDRPDIDLAFAVGATDRDPSVSRFYAWKRSAWDRAGGYAPQQEREDPPLLLRAFRAGLRIRRVLLPAVAEDLKERHPSRAPSVGPWARAPHATRAARRFRVQGFRYGEFVRFLYLTRRTPARFVAGVGVAGLGYVVGAVRRDGPAFLELEPEDRIADVRGPHPSEPPARGAR